MGSVIVKDVQNISYNMKLEFLISKVTIKPTIGYKVQKVSETSILVYTAHDLRSSQNFQLH